MLVSPEPLGHHNHLSCGSDPALPRLPSTHRTEPRLLSPHTRPSGSQPPLSSLAHLSPHILKISLLSKVHSSPETLNCADSADTPGCCTSWPLYVPFWLQHFPPPFLSSVNPNPPSTSRALGWFGSVLPQCPRHHDHFSCHTIQRNYMAGDPCRLKLSRTHIEKREKTGELHHLPQVTQPVGGGTPLLTTH